MYGFGLVALLIALAVSFVYFKPELSPVTPTSPTSTSTPASRSIGAARDICLSSAKAALRGDLMIAGLDCPTQSKSCASQSQEGAKAYAKYEGALAGCSK